jgi:3-oxoacyl-[acyl-carrier protein] reductase
LTNAIHGFGHCTPEEIAAVVSFLIGPDGGLVNGQMLHAHDGMV